MAHLGAERPARVDDVEVTEIDDGLVVYRGGPDRVHVLNRTAAFVYELCSGDRTPQEIAEETARAFGLEDPPSEAVAGCLAELRAKGLVR